MCWEGREGSEGEGGEEVKEGEGLGGCVGEERKGGGREIEVEVGVVGGEVREKGEI